MSPVVRQFMLCHQS